MIKLEKMTLKLMVSVLFVLSAVGFGEETAKDHDKSLKAYPVKESLDSDAKLFDYKQIELENGLDVITLEDFSTPIVAAQVWYHVGSKNEDPDRQGFAHMFEHMMFKGTDRVSDRDHFELIRSVGGTTNAYTSFDTTVYIQTLPANQLELALWLEAERMSFLKINQQTFNTERKVVEEELRMGENRPYGTLYKKTFAALFDKHPYQWTPIGKMAHLRAASVKELRNFWKEYYVPNNATLVIVGAVKHKEAQKLAKKYFSWIPKYPQPERVKIKEPEPQGERTIVIENENAPTGLVQVLWRTVPVGYKHEVVLDLLSSILGGGNSSRLYRDLVAENQIAVDAGSYTYNLEDDGIFAVNITEGPESDPDLITRKVKKHIAKIAAEGVTDIELQKARNQMLKQVVTQNLTIDSKARLLGTYAVKVGDLSKVNTRLEDINSVTEEDIQAAARKYLAADRALIVIVKENKGGTKDIAQAGVTAAPELEAPKPGREGVVRGEDFPDQAPVAELKDYKVSSEYKTEKLPNGLKIMVVENHEVPYVTVQLGLQGGAWTESKPGTAAMTLSMLTKGTENYSEGELAEELERYAIYLAGNAGMDTSQVQAGCLTPYTGKALELMSEIVLRPTFDSREFAKLSRQVITGLKIEQSSPKYLAANELRSRLYGKHPYSRPVEGEVSDVKALKPADLKLWWRKWSRPDKAALIFAGDITMKRAKELSRKAFGNWKIGLVEMGLVLPDIPDTEKTRIYLVDVPGSEQSEIRVGTLGFTRKRQPEYFTSRVVSSYFGGSFNSRLNETIRIDKGLTYGARGGWSARRMAGAFTVSTFTKNASTAETVEVIFDEIKRLRNEKPSPDVLENTKNYFAGSFVRTRETPQSVADDLWLIESHNLSSDYLDRLLKSIAETTASQCTDLAKSTIDPDEMILVVVGNAKEIQNDLEKIAPVTVVKENILRHN